MDISEGFDLYHNNTSLFPHPFQSVKNTPPTPDQQKLRSAVHECIQKHQRAEEESRQATLLGNHSTLYKGLSSIRRVHSR